MPALSCQKARSSASGAEMRKSRSVRRLQEGGVRGCHGDQRGATVDSGVSAVEQSREFRPRFVGGRVVAEGSGGRGIAGGASLEVGAGLAGLPVYLTQLAGGRSERGDRKSTR